MHSHKSNESQEDYLESIFVITQNKEFCRSVDVANELEVSKANVSIAVSKPQNGRHSARAEVEKTTTSLIFLGSVCSDALYVSV